MCELIFPNEGGESELKLLSKMWKHVKKYQNDHVVNPEAAVKFNYKKARLLDDDDNEISKFMNLYARKNDDDGDEIPMWLKNRVGEEG